MAVARGMAPSLLHPTRGSLLRAKTRPDWLPTTDLTSLTLGAPLFWPMIDLPVIVVPGTGRWVNGQLLKIAPSTFRSTLPVQL